MIPGIPWNGFAIHRMTVMPAVHGRRYGIGQAPSVRAIDLSSPCRWCLSTTPILSRAY